MDCKEHLAASCDTLSTTAPEVRWNLQMCTAMVKQETVDFIDEEEPPCSEDMYPAEHIQSSKYVNYYDSKDCELKQLKEEFPEDECLQSHISMISKLVPQNNILLKLIDNQEVKHEKTEEGFPLKIKEEKDNKNDQVTVKTERLDEQDILDAAVATIIQNDVLVTHQEVQGKSCGRIFKNSFNLLKHNQEHVKVQIIKPGVNEINELHQCQYCDTYFDNHDNMLMHISLVHYQKTSKCRLFGGKQFKSASNLKRHNQILHKYKNSTKQVTGKSRKCKYCNVYFEPRYTTLCKHMEHCRTSKQDEGIKYKCDSCDCVCSSKKTLSVHIKRTHIDYGRIFDCWCGESFRTPIHLNEHMRLRHCIKRKYKTEVYKCKRCKRFYKTNQSLTKHIKRMHYEYGRKFDCCCGKQFRSPIQLDEHEKRQHVHEIQNTNKDKFQCDMCQNFFKYKSSLVTHIKRNHTDYNKVFDCWCGGHFLTPMHLAEHMRRKHNRKIQNTKNIDKFQCDMCKKFFTYKSSLVTHIKRCHTDYDKVFECWCGELFLTPIHLVEHERLQHNRELKNSNKKKYQCDMCQKFFIYKNSLVIHIRRIHHDYDKLFECWCGEKFRSPLQLDIHKKAKHVFEHDGFKFVFSS